MPPAFFFLGKGGVGKSTCSALTALGLARRGLEVGLISLDPAHNQRDILEVRLSHRPRRIQAGLVAVEVDLDRWVGRYLGRVQERISESYRYLTAFNLEKYFRVLRHAPGLEEHALILAYESFCERFATADALVFDMPPTALALRFFNLPSLTLVWARHLLELRQQILKRRELVTRIRLLGREVETDRVLRRLGESIEQYAALEELFRDGCSTRVTVVMTPDPLALAESKRIVEHLLSTGVRPQRLLVNGVEGPEDEALAAIRPEFPGLEAVSVPRSPEPLLGLGALAAFLDGGRFPVPELERRGSSE